MTQPKHLFKATLVAMKIFIASASSVSLTIATAPLPAHAQSSLPSPALEEAAASLAHRGSIDAHSLSAMLDRLDVPASGLSAAIDYLSRTFHISALRLSSEYLQIAFKEGGAGQALRSVNALGTLGNAGLKNLPEDLRAQVLAEHIKQSYEREGQAGAKAAQAELTRIFGPNAAQDAAALLPAGWFDDDKHGLELAQISPASGDESGDEPYHG